MDGSACHHTVLTQTWRGLGRRRRRGPAPPPRGTAPHVLRRHCALRRRRRHGRRGRSSATGPLAASVVAPHRRTVHPARGGVCAGGIPPRLTDPTPPAGVIPTSCGCGCSTPHGWAPKAAADSRGRGARPPHPAVADGGKGGRRGGPWSAGKDGGRREQLVQPCARLQAGGCSGGRRLPATHGREGTRGHRLVGQRDWRPHPRQSDQTRAPGGRDKGRPCSGERYGSSRGRHRPPPPLLCRGRRC